MQDPDKANLLALGLSDHEAEVYLALVEAGESTVGPLISYTGLHRNVVYTSLAHLVSRKLISEKQVRGKKQFSINSPQFLVNELEQKVILAQEVANALARKQRQGLQEISVHQGNDEYLTLLTGIISTMPKGSTKYVLGTGGEHFMALTMRPIWDLYHGAVQKAGIKIRMLGYKNQRSAIAPDIGKELPYTIRYLPDQFENPAGVHIYPEAETILNIIYSDVGTPVTAIRIRNPSLAAGYLSLFKNLWRSAT